MHPAKDTGDCIISFSGIGLRISLGLQQLKSLCLSHWVNYCSYLSQSCILTVLEYDSKLGFRTLLQSVTLNDSGKHYTTRLEFLIYGTRQSKSKSGAYLFLPSGEAQVRNDHNLSGFWSASLIIYAKEYLDEYLWMDVGIIGTHVHPLTCILPSIATPHPNTIFSKFIM